MARTTIMMRIVACVSLLSLSMVLQASAQDGLFRIEGQALYDSAGKAVALIGDVDADGIPDFLVGFPGDPQVTFAGRVILYAGRDGRELWRLDAARPKEQLGDGLAALGDIDADGIEDFAVGSRESPLAQLGGMIQVFSGRTRQRLHNVVSSAVFASIGYAMSGLGDVDSDGHGDFVYGGPGERDTTLQRYGVARVVSGKTGQALREHWGLDSNGAFGLSVSGIGDFDRDGVGDYAVGALATSSSSRIGAAFVYSGKTGALLHRFDSASSSDSFGGRVCGAGDVDKDGWPDLAVAAPQSSLASFYAGAVFVYSGRTKQEIRRVVGEQGDLLGSQLVQAGDVDGDGVPDLAASTQHNRVKVYSGADGSLLLLVSGEPDSQFGLGLAGGRDIDLDGRSDLLIGAPRQRIQSVDAGRATLFVSRKLTLRADGHFVSLAQPAPIAFSIDVGREHGGKLYLVLGSASGFRPGLGLDSFLLPLNPDLYLWFTLTAPNTLIEASLGFLDFDGRQACRLVIPKGLPLTLAGSTLDHACVVFARGVNNGYAATTNHVPMHIRP